MSHSSGQRPRREEEKKSGASSPLRKVKRHLQALARAREKNCTPEVIRKRAATNKKKQRRNEALQKNLDRPKRTSIIEGDILSF